MPSKHKWQFAPKFRKNAFGWKSQPAIKRIKEAVSEIEKINRKDAPLAADGAVLFFEKISPAIAHVDGSSGAIGGAVNSAINKLVPIIAKAETDENTRKKWLERLWKAIQDDEIPYIESIGDYWGDLCASKEIASFWADELVEGVKLSCDTRFGYFAGTTLYLSALYKAERFDELLELLSSDRLKLWDYQQFAVKAIADSGKPIEAVEYAQKYRLQSYSDSAIALLCEEILLKSGFEEEAYSQYAFEANRCTTNLATYRAIAKKYPRKNPEDILADLIDTTPGSEGKWFATAKTLGYLDLASTLAKSSPCDPGTLTRAARDFQEKNPEFATSCGLSAIHWLIEGYGYEATSWNLKEAFEYAISAAEKIQAEKTVIDQIKQYSITINEHNQFATVVKQLAESVS